MIGDQPVARRALLRHGTTAAGTGLVPGVEGACHDHRVCVAVCPERALTGWELDGRRGVALRLEACTGCGRCVALCPERALVLAPRPADGPAIVPLTVHSPRTCSVCEATFVGAAEDELCPACAKDRSLFGPAGRAVAGRLGPTSEQGEPM